jgi:hypothetical protein
VRLISFSQFPLFMSVKHLLLVWMLACAVLAGSAYNLYRYCGAQNIPDSYTYLSIANGHFKDQSLTRRYRILVPFAAKMVSLPIEKTGVKLFQNRTEQNVLQLETLKLGFLIVNLVLMATVGLVIYLTGKAYGISEWGSLLGMFAVLCGGRWASLLAGTPLTDSLYFLILALTVLGIKTRSHKLLACCILFGLLAKESFVFVLPVIFFFAAMEKWKQILLAAVSFAFFWAVRYVIDQAAGSAASESLVHDAGHIANMTDSLRHIFSLHGISDLSTVLGLFGLILLAGFTGGKKAISSWFSGMDAFLGWFAVAMLLHALLSGEVGRMLYLGSSVWAIMIGLIWDRHPLFRGKNVSGKPSEHAF